MVLKAQPSYLGAWAFRGLGLGDLKVLQGFYSEAGMGLGFRVEGLGFRCFECTWWVVKIMVPLEISYIPGASFGEPRKGP